MVSNGATVKQNAGAVSARGRKSTIVARGQLDGVRCVDMLIDTGASCCFIRRSWAQQMSLQQLPLTEKVTVTLADSHTTEATHEVRVDRMSIYGSSAACTLLVMDELSNDVIVGMNWQRAAGIAITPGEPYDMLNGKPVRNSPPAEAVVKADSEPWPRDMPVVLSAALVHSRQMCVQQSPSDVKSSANSLPTSSRMQSTASMDVADVSSSRLRQVLQRHSSVFTDVLPVKTAEQIEKAMQFRIVLVGDSVRPVKQRERRLSPAEIEAATQWVRDEVAAGRMEPSSSEWAAQLVIVAKRNEKGEVSGWRICGDYRSLNDVTKADAEPLPLMQSVFDQLAGMQYFSKLDLLKGFNQIPVEKQSRELMAVSTPAGLYQPTVMPFGVKNAPGSFQREMRRVLQKRLNKGVFVFIDDIIVYSKTEDEHVELIEFVLSRLQEEGYFAHPAKCQFFRPEVNFLGHIVSRDGVSMQQHKVASVADWPVPQSVKDVRAFLGLAGFYRRFVAGFSSIALPLTDLTQTTDRKWFDWRAEQQRAFDQLKRALTEAPVLAHPDPYRQWIVQTDASGVAMGAVLSQRQDDGTIRPVAFYSHKFTSAERAYTASERELLAIVRAVQEWRVYLFGSPHPVLLRSDHQPLIWLNKKPELLPRLGRWMEQLCDLTFEIGYVKGKDNAAADALSRRADYDTGGSAAQPAQMKVKLIAASTDVSEASRLAAAHVWRVTGKWMDGRPISSANSVPKSEANSKANSSQLSAVTRRTSDEPAATETQLQVDSLLSDMRVAAGRDEEYQILLKGEDKADGLQRRDGLVYSRSGAVYVPADRRMRTRLLELAHDAAGHFGRSKTIGRLARHCIWTGMSKEVEDYCRSCQVCAVCKGSNELPAGKLQPMPIPDRPWDSVGVDFTGPLPPTKEGHNSIMVIIDRFSKMVVLRPCKTDITGIQAGRLLLEHAMMMGRVPTSIVSDRDVRFTGASWGQLWRAMETQLKQSTAFHPQTDGQTENANKTMQAVLRSYAEARVDWDEWLPFVAAAYNSTVQDSTGRTPFEMNYPDDRSIDPLKYAIRGLQSGRVTDSRGVSAEAERTLTEMQVIWDEVRARLVLAQARQKKYADMKRRDVKYDVGDSVYLSTRNLRTHGGKLVDKWAGPYVVTQVIDGGQSVRLDLRGELGKVKDVFHVSLLKPYVEAKLEWPGRQHHNRPAPVLVDGETEWEVERVTGKKIETERQKVTKTVTDAGQRSGGRTLRPRPPRQVTVMEDVDVVWYKLKWAGYEGEDEWRRASDCHCAEKIEEYELLQRQREEQQAVEDGTQTKPAVELGLATVMEWWLTDKRTTSRRGRPTVRCSYASVQPVVSRPVQAA